MPTAPVTDAHGKSWDAEGTAWIRSAAWPNHRAVVTVSDGIFQVEIQKPVTIGVWLPTALPEPHTSFDDAALFAYTLMGG